MSSLASQVVQLPAQPSSSWMTTRALIGVAADHDVVFADHGLVVVERGGIPLALRLTGANTHDSRVFAELLDAIVPIKGPHGRPRKRPTKLHADKAYDIPRCWRALTQRRITVRIARKGVESSQRLGRHRWVVERTLAWLARFRRLTIRYERRGDLHEAFLHLGCALICLNSLS